VAKVLIERCWRAIVPSPAAKPPGWEKTSLLAAKITGKGTVARCSNTLSARNRQQQANGAPLLTPHHVALQSFLSGKFYLKP
jgi:hypothetical protein